MGKQLLYISIISHFFLFTLSTKVISQNFELGFHFGTDYSLIQPETQDYPLILNLHGGFNFDDRFSIISHITTSRRWLTQNFSYLELGAGGEYTLYSDEILDLSFYGLLYLGLGSYIYYEYESSVHEHWSLGISPGLSINERTLLKLRFQYYSGFNNETNISGLRLYLGLIYKI